MKTFVEPRIDILMFEMVDIMNTSPETEEEEDTLPEDEF